MQTNDALWQGAIEDFPFEFVKKIYPDVYPYIDLAHETPIEFLDKELAQLHHDSEIGLKIVDKLLRVHLKGTGETRMLYIHFEAQGYQDDLFGRRNFVYYYRLFDLYGDNITVLILLTDSNPKYMPSIFEVNCMGLELYCKFPVYKIMAQNPIELAASDNLFDAAILTAYWAIQKKRGKLSEEDLMECKLDLMRRLLSKNVDKNKIRQLLDFIKRYVSFEKAEITATFERQFDELIKFEKNMGISEIIIKQATDAAKLAANLEADARVQAAQQAAKERRIKRKTTVHNMRVHGFSLEKIADILGYSIAEVTLFFNELDSEK